jgi:hypothetical protein
MSTRSLHPIPRGLASFYSKKSSTLKQSSAAVVAAAADDDSTDGADDEKRKVSTIAQPVTIRFKALTSKGSFAEVIGNIPSGSTCAGANFIAVPAQVNQPRVPSHKSGSRGNNNENIVSGHANNNNNNNDDDDNLVAVLMGTKSGLNKKVFRRHPSFRFSKTSTAAAGMLTTTDEGDETGVKCDDGDDESSSASRVDMTPSCLLYLVYRNSNHHRRSYHWQTVETSGHCHDASLGGACSWIMKNESTGFLFAYGGLSEMTSSLTGSRSSGGGDCKSFAVSYISALNLETLVWRRISVKLTAGAPSPRHNASFVYDDDEKVAYVFGGLSNNEDMIRLQDLWRLDMSYIDFNVLEASTAVSGGKNADGVSGAFWEKLCRDGFPAKKKKVHPGSHHDDKPPGNHRHRYQGVSSSALALIRKKERKGISKKLFAYGGTLFDDKNLGEDDDDFLFLVSKPCDRFCYFDINEYENSRRSRAGVSSRHGWQPVVVSGGGRGPGNLSGHKMFGIDDDRYIGILGGKNENNFFVYLFDLELSSWSAIAIDEPQISGLSMTRHWACTSLTFPHDRFEKTKSKRRR